MENRSIGGIVNRLRRKMAENYRGDLSFYEYMNDCLYDPDYGYYMRDVPKIGREGDFLYERLRRQRDGQNAGQIYRGQSDRVRSL